MKRLIVIGLLAGSSPALADDAISDVIVPIDVAVKTQPTHYSAWWKRLYLRAGVAHLAPLSSSRELELADVDGPASLAVKNGPIAGSGSEISSSTFPAMIIGYTLPVWNDRLSLEFIVAPPLDVKFTATGTLATTSIAPMALGIPTGVEALGPQLGEAKAIPPVLTAVYHFRERGPITPLLGAGISVLFATGETVTNPTLTEVSQPTMSVAPAPGFVMQAGADLKLWKRVHARFDVKYIAGMLARARVEHIQVRTPSLPLFDTVEVGTAKMSVWVNPLVVQLGIGIDLD